METISTWLIRCIFGMEECPRIIIKQHVPTLEFITARTHLCTIGIRIKHFIGIRSNVNRVCKRPVTTLEFPTKRVTGALGHLWVHNRTAYPLETFAHQFALTHKAHIVVAVCGRNIQCQLRGIVICATAAKHHIVNDNGGILVIHTIAGCKCQVKQFTIIARNAVVSKRKGNEPVSILVHLRY